MNIKERREELGISQKELAKNVGITQSFLCDIEQGRRKPSMEIGAKIAGELDLKRESKAMAKGCNVRDQLFNRSE